MRKINQKEERRHLANNSVRSLVKGKLQRAQESLARGEGAEEALRKAITILDRAAGQGVIHPNKAARHKSRLMKLHQAKTDSSSS